MSARSKSQDELRHIRLLVTVSALLCSIANQPVLGQWGNNSKMADFKGYITQANGAVDLATASQQLLVPSPQQCSALCARLLVCSAFSMKRRTSGSINSNGFGHYQCTLTMGDFTWTPEDNSTLYILDMGSLDGYTLSTDGRYYKLFNGGPWPISEIQRACVGNNVEVGRLAVAYPGSAHKALMSFLAGKSYSSFYVDTYRTGTVAEGRWITTDGAIFYASNRTLDTDQRWASASQPDGSGYGLVFSTSAGGYDDMDNLNVTSVICRRDPMYRKSPVNGKFYKLHQQKMTWVAAAAECAKEGATLANVYFDADQIATEPYRMMTRGLGNLAYPHGFWVGGTDNETENTWVFPDGTVFVLNKGGDPLQNRLWQAGEPNGGTSANCLTMSYQGAGDFQCNDAAVLRSFLCEIKLP